MNLLKPFHGLTGGLRFKLGFWIPKSVTFTHEHLVKYSRELLYRFTTHVHPYSERLVSELVEKDIAGLEAIDTLESLRSAFFNRDYAPVAIVKQSGVPIPGGGSVAVLAPSTSTLPEAGMPVDELDFDYAEGAYSVYNWETFFHIPYTLALHLSKNGHHQEAQRWFHYIFDPTAASDPTQGPKRFWKVKPFKIDEVEHVQATLKNLATIDDEELWNKTVRAISAWRANPLRPHLVARTRPTAYMYATVMAYLDNLIAWGDSLFRQDTRESINEAMQLYVLAANLLGPRPQPVPRRGTVKAQSYNSLKLAARRRELDEFGNAAVALEAELAFDLFPAVEGNATPTNPALKSLGQTLYFCVPRNEKFLRYWDVVGDRLYKIRNSLNLQGTFRQLPLFAPPIDPAMLARAIAAGVDVGAIIAGGGAELTPVRFGAWLQKAVDACQEVKALGGQILAALEKKDNETLGVLRAKHEHALLEAADAVKYAQWQESIKSKEGIERNILNAFERYRYYLRQLATPDEEIVRPAWTPFAPATRIDESTRTFGDEPVVPTRDIAVEFKDSWFDGGHPINKEEAKELDLMQVSQIMQDVASGLEAVGAILNMIPQIELSVKPFGLGTGLALGGLNVSGLLSGLASAGRGFAGRVSFEAGMSGRMAGFVRREQDWAFQANSAAGELGQLYKQYRAAEIREHISKTEYQNHQTQKTNSEEVKEFLTNEKNQLTGVNRKTTDEKFYLWMKGEVQTLHAQYFQFAYELAKRAEAAFAAELAATPRFIQSTYLAGREGLLAGERLALDLKRMESAYLEQNTRELEITKHISLKEWFPLKLRELRTTGACGFDVSEEVLDLDCAGHVLRRIKSVAISLPCVVGPYASINCSLTLGANSFRRPDDTMNDTPVSAIKAIVTSSAQSDTGMFETNLRDDRYLPFEGAGAISHWDLALLGSPRSFDYDTIADVVLTLRFTAKAGGATNTSARALKYLKEHSARAFSLRHEFAAEWARYRQTGNLKFTLTEAHFPYRFKGEGATPIGKARHLHLFMTGVAGSEVRLNHADIKETQKFANTATSVDFDAPFTATGEFELIWDSKVLEDLWMVVDWTL